jgi:hypothetical protein
MPQSNHWSFLFTKNFCLSALALVLLFTTALFLPEIAFGKSVALNVVVADEIAIQSSTSVIVERLFKDKLPDTEFRRVVVQAQSPAIPHLFSDNVRVHAELKQQLAEILHAGDTLTYLILDTHGETLKPENAGNPRDAGVTRLLHLGDISFAGGVSHEFADLFDAVKPYASSKLTIIMNACSVFCGGEKAASLRAESMLAYFGAIDGTIYGATLPEIDTFAFERQYSTWRDFLPSKKMFWMTNVMSLMMSTTLALAVAQSHDGNPYVYFGSSLALIQAFNYLRPWIMKAADVLKMANLGYLFQFHRGKLIKTEFMQKMKDVARSFALKGKVSTAEADTLLSSLGRPAAGAGLRCQYLFL